MGIFSRAGLAVFIVLQEGRPLKNVQFCSRPRKEKILTTPEKYAPHFTGQAGIQGVFRGLKFESDSGIGQKRTLFKGLKRREGT